MFRMEVKVEGESFFIGAFSRFGERTRDLTPVWEVIGNDFLAVTAQLFDTEGSSGGRKWAALAPSTLRRKPPGLPILVHTGELRSSLTQQGGANIRQISKMKAVFGTRDPKAQFHFYGTRNMPARPPIAITDIDRRRWVKYAQAHVVAEARAAGLLRYGGA